MRPRLLMTFDDDTVDHWFAHRGVLDDVGARVTFFVSHADRLTDEQTDKLRALQRDGHTVGSHGLRHLDAPRHVAEHGLADYVRQEIEPSITALVDRGLGARDFAYPFGRHDRAIDQALASRFSWLRTTTPRTDDDGEALLDLDRPPSERVLRSRGIDVGRAGQANPDDSDALLTLLDRAALTGASLCLFAHDIAAWDEGLAGGRNFITPQRLREVLSAAAERGLLADGFGVLPD